MLADVDLWDYRSRQGVGEDLALEVLENKFFICWLKTKTRRQFAHSIFNKIQLFHLLSKLWTLKNSRTKG